MYSNVIVNCDIKKQEWEEILSHPEIPEETKELILHLQKHGPVEHRDVYLYHKVERANRFFKETGQKYRIRKVLFANWRAQPRVPGKFGLVIVEPYTRSPA